MSTRVPIVDTSAVVALVAIGQLELLPTLYGEVLPPFFMDEPLMKHVLKRANEDVQIRLNPSRQRRVR